MESQQRLNVLTYVLSRAIDESKRLRMTLDRVYGKLTVDAIVEVLGLPVEAFGTEEGGIGRLTDGEMIYVVFSLTEDATYQALLFLDTPEGVTVCQVDGDNAGNAKKSREQRFNGTVKGDLLKAFERIVGGE